MNSTTHKVGRHGMESLLCKVSMSSDSLLQALLFWRLSACLALTCSLTPTVDDVLTALRSMETTLV